MENPISVTAFLVLLAASHPPSWHKLPACCSAGFAMWLVIITTPFYT